MKPIEEFPAIKKAVNDGIASGLHRLHAETDDPTYLEAQEYVIGAIKARLDALVEKPLVKSYCGGKPNYCTPVDAVSTSQERVDETVKREHEPVAYTGNGTAGREADVQPTGFFFQMLKPVGEVYGWHGTGKGQPMCRFDTSEAEMPVGTKLYTLPPKREWVGLTDEEIMGMTCECVDDGTFNMDCARDYARWIEDKLKEKNHGLL